MRPEKFSDTRSTNSGRKQLQERTPEEEIACLKHKVAFQKQQIKTLKKMKQIERSILETLAITEEKFKVIDKLIIRDNNLLNIHWLYEIAEESESGFYNWRNNKSKREVRNIQDELDFTLILEASNYRGGSVK
ncbi:MAG: hypothetical protein ACK5KR_08540 [Breznakia sp.]